MNSRPRTPGKRLRFEDAVQIWRKILAGEYLHRIAAHYDINPGRISEIKTGKRFPGSRDVALGG